MGDSDGAAALVGTTLRGQYHLTRLVGRGNFGTVYEAECSRLSRRVALKILHPKWEDRSDIVLRIEREAKAIAALNHPGFPAIHDYLPAEHAIVMELLEGHTLEQLIATGSVPIARCVAILRSVLEALACAHDHDLVHRDVKPENIFVCTSADGREHAKLLDFGFVHAATNDKLTSDGGFVGTVRYASPEHLHDAGSADARSDVYSFAATAFELLTGQSIVGTCTSEEARHRIRTGACERHPAEHRLEVPAWLDRVVARSLDPDPASRPSSARTVLAEFERPANVASSVSVSVVPLVRAERRLASITSDDRLTSRLVPLADDDLDAVWRSLGGGRRRLRKLTHLQKVARIADKIRVLSGHSLINLVRRKQREWNEILYQIARKLTLDVSETSSVNELENALIDEHTDETNELVKERAAFRGREGNALVVARPEERIEAARLMARRASRGALSPTSHGGGFFRLILAIFLWPLILIQGPAYRRPRHGHHHRALARGPQAAEHRHQSFAFSRLASVLRLIPSRFAARSWTLFSAFNTRRM